MARPKSGSPRDSTATIGFEAKIWLAADTTMRVSANRNRAANWRDLRGAQDRWSNNMDAAEYKHVVLGLIFLKYNSDTFEEHRAKLLAGANPEDPDTAMRASACRCFRRSCISQDLRGAKVQYRDENVFWVPADARWSHLQANAKPPTIGKTVDDAMVDIERDNPRVKGVLPKDSARPGLDKHRLGDIIIYRQESSENSRHLAVMNLALRGIEADLGPEHADTFRRDIHHLHAKSVLNNGKAYG